MFGFGTAAVLLGAPLQRLDNVLWNISDQKLGHVPLLLLSDDSLSVR